MLDVKKICQYGGFCRSDSDCVLGNKCMIQSEYYSQCIPDTSSYSDVSTGCVAQYGRCSSTTKCCDPVQFVQVIISAFSRKLQTVCTLADILMERLGRLSPKSPFKYAMLRIKDSGETFSN